MPSMNTDYAEYLRRGIPPLLLKVYEPQLRLLLEGFGKLLKAGEDSGIRQEPDETDRLRRFAEFIASEVAEENGVLTRLSEGLSAFNRRLARLETEEERRALIIDYVRSLGRSARQISGDRRAFGRWFEADAAIERARRRICGSEFRIAFLLERLGSLSRAALQSCGDSDRRRRIWQRLDLEKLCLRLLTHGGDPRVRIAAFGCLGGAVSAMEQNLWSTLVDEGTASYIYRSAQDGSQAVEIQSGALGLLAIIDPEAFSAILTQRLENPGPGDNLFVRRRGLALLQEHHRRFPQLCALLQHCLDDPSPYVRQGLAEVCAQITAEGGEPQHGVLEALALDEQPEVRVALLVQICRHLSAVRPRWVSGQIVSVLQSRNAPLVVRAACRCACLHHQGLIEGGRQGEAGEFLRLVLPELDALHAGASPLALRRWAAETREFLVVSCDPQAKQLLQKLGPVVEKVRPGGSRRIPSSLIAGQPEERIGRVLALLSRNSFGLSLERGPTGVRLYRGHRYVLRWWRVLYELRHPSPDKRQGFRHTTGRDFPGDLRAPSGILAELTQTKVPGEPLYLSSEEGWRPYLPLVDEAVSLFDHGSRRRPVRIYTAEGVTEMLPPRSPFKRLAGALRLTLGFARYAQLRNWKTESGLPPEGYVEALRELGMEVRFRGHDPDRVDPAVSRFFLGMPLVNPRMIEGFRDYILSVYGNSLYELGLFAVAVTAWFLGSRAWITLRLARARKRLALVIGGWGTRGKSGTERLKAAVLESVGAGLVSKTTGCEAMFLYAYPFGKTREMFLFRPYDKASIWEHRGLIELAVEMGAPVFLWECMALTPEFVSILQTQWSRDDISTLTNAYPDHEDIQGPAGINIPEVMTRFIPRKGELITSEEVMLPILAEGARSRGTRLRSVGWLEAGLIPPDILARFPYAEHPYNIALVQAMAAELGIAPDTALKEMADRVVPDLGVLKTFPLCRVRGRVLEFSNGMSANERYGTLNNWKRMAYEGQDPEKDPSVFITTVVNNRADRIARSRVFAGMLVNDLSADRHVLIGSNLNGLMGYIRQEWQDRLNSCPLFPEQETGLEEGLEHARTLARFLRLPLGLASVAGRIEAMLTGCGREGVMVDPQSLAAEGGLESLVAAEVEEQDRNDWLEHLRPWRDASLRWSDFERNLLAGGERKALEEEFRALVQEWFLAKLVVVEDFHATGDEVVATIAAAAPPGLLNRVMGLQNIKGTGLDFVYRWQAWDRCHEMLSRLGSDDPDLALGALRELVGFQEFGLLSAEEVRRTLSRASGAPWAQTEEFHAGLRLVEEHLRQALEKGKKGPSAADNGMFSRILGLVEAVLDAGDAVKRRKAANAVYRDLADERISLDRAVIELQKLNKRQKGGWFIARVKSLRGRGD